MTDEEREDFVDRRGWSKQLKLSVEATRKRPPTPSNPRLERGLGKRDHARSFRGYAHPLRAQV